MALLSTSVEHLVIYRVLSKVSTSDSSFITIDFIRLRLPCQQIPFLIGFLPLITLKEFWRLTKLQQTSPIQIPLECKACRTPKDLTSELAFRQRMQIGIHLRPKDVRICFESHVLGGNNTNNECP